MFSACLRASNALHGAVAHATGCTAPGRGASLRGLLTRPAPFVVLRSAALPPAAASAPPSASFHTSAAAASGRHGNSVPDRVKHWRKHLSKKAEKRYKHRRERVAEAARSTRPPGTLASSSHVTSVVPASAGPAAALPTAAEMRRISTENRVIIESFLRLEPRPPTAAETVAELDAPALMRGLASGQVPRTCSNVHTVLRALGLQGRFAEAVALFASMRAWGLAPHTHEYNHLILAAAQQRNMAAAFDVYDSMQAAAAAAQPAAPLLLAAGGGSSISGSNNRSGNAGTGGAAVAVRGGPAAAAGAPAVASSRRGVPAAVPGAPVPDEVTFGALMQACVRARDLGRAFAVLQAAEAAGVPLTPVLFTHLIVGCAHAGQYERAWAVFDHMRTQHCEPDAVAFTAMIDVCAKTDRVERALNLLTEMKQADMPLTAVTYNAAMHAAGRSFRRAHAAHGLFEEMEAAGLAHDLYSYTAVLTACSHTGDVARARAYMWRLHRDGLEPSLVTVNALLSVYARALRPAVQNAERDATVRAMAASDAGARELLQLEDPDAAAALLAGTKRVLGDHARLVEGDPAQLVENMLADYFQEDEGGGAGAGDSGAGAGDSGAGSGRGKGGRRRAQALEASAGGGSASSQSVLVAAAARAAEDDPLATGGALLPPVSAYNDDTTSAGYLAVRSELVQDLGADGSALLEAMEADNARPPPADSDEEALRDEVDAAADAAWRRRTAAAAVDIMASEQRLAEGRAALAVRAADAARRLGLLGGKSGGGGSGGGSSDGEMVASLSKEGLEAARRVLAVRAPTATAAAAAGSDGGGGGDQPFPSSASAPPLRSDGRMSMRDFMRGLERSVEAELLAQVNHGGDADAASDAAIAGRGPVPLLAAGGASTAAAASGALVPVGPARPSSLFGSDAEGEIGGESVDKLLDIRDIQLPPTSDSDGDHDPIKLHDYFAQRTARRLLSALDREFAGSEVDARLDAQLSDWSNSELSDAVAGRGLGGGGGGARQRRQGALPAAQPRQSLLAAPQPATAAATEGTEQQPSAEGVSAAAAQEALPASLAHAAVDAQGNVLLEHVARPSASEEEPPPAPGLVRRRRSGVPQDEAARLMPRPANLAPVISSALLQEILLAPAAPAPQAQAQELPEAAVAAASSSAAAPPVAAGAALVETEAAAAAATALAVAQPPPSAVTRIRGSGGELAEQAPNNAAAAASALAVAPAEAPRAVVPAAVHGRMPSVAAVVATARAEVAALLMRAPAHGVSLHPPKKPAQLQAAAAARNAAKRKGPEGLESAAHTAGDELEAAGEAERAARMQDQLLQRSEQRRVVARAMARLLQAAVLPRLDRALVLAAEDVRRYRKRRLLGTEPGTLDTLVAVQTLKERAVAAAAAAGAGGGAAGAGARASRAVAAATSAAASSAAGAAGAVIRVQQAAAGDATADARTSSGALKRQGALAAASGSGGVAAAVAVTPGAPAAQQQQQQQPSPPPLAPPPPSSRGAALHAARQEAAMHAAGRLAVAGAGTGTARAAALVRMSDRLLSGAHWAPGAGATAGALGSALGALQGDLSGSDWSDHEDEDGPPGSPRAITRARVRAFRARRAALLAEAEAVFHRELPALGLAPDRVTLNTMVGAYAAAGDAPRAYGFVAAEFGRAGVRPDARTFRALVRMHVRCSGRGAERTAAGAARAEALLALMQRSGVRPDADTYGLLVHARARAWRLKDAVALLEEMRGAGLACPEYYAHLLRQRCKEAGIFHAAVPPHPVGWQFTPAVMAKRARRGRVVHKLAQFLRPRMPGSKYR